MCAGIAILTLAALVLLMWLPYTVTSGFNAETGFIYKSETSSFWNGFLYPHDALRPFTNFFYHIGYLLGIVLRVRGSFVPIQVVHAALWLGRGILTFLILRKFLPGYLPFCFLAGVIVLVHASDGAINWAGQINQFGFIFWMLLAFYLLLSAIEARKSAVFIVLTLLACACIFMSLWSYEAQIFLILLAPLTIWIFRPGYRRRVIAASILWYAVPVHYVLASIRKYKYSSGSSYQESVLRKSWHARDVIADWLFSMGTSLKFWDWARTTPLHLTHSQAVGFGIAGALIFLIGACAVLFVLRKSGKLDALREPAAPLWWALITGIVVLVLSFPVYLLLDDLRNLWRTQFLSGIGAGITLSAIACLIIQYCRPHKLQLALFVSFGAAVVYSGAYSAVVRGAFERYLWERHRSAIAQILSVLPSVKPETIFIYTGIPKNDDPLAEGMWFDLALRLSYPDTPLAGEFFYDDGTPGPGNCFHLVGDQVRWDGTGIESMIQETSVKYVVVLEFQPHGPVRIARQLPAVLHPSEEAQLLYSPQRVLGDAPVSPLAIRRYGPIPACQPLCLSQAGSP